MYGLFYCTLCGVLGSAASNETVPIIYDIAGTTVIMTSVEPTSKISNGKLNDLT